MFDRLGGGTTAQSKGEVLATRGEYTDRGESREITSILHIDRKIPFLALQF